MWLKGHFAAFKGAFGLPTALIGAALGALGLMFGLAQFIGDPLDQGLRTVVKLATTDWRDTAILFMIFIAVHLYGKYWYSVTPRLALKFEDDFYFRR